MERLVLMRINAKLGDKLHRTQAGFRQKRSTIDNIYHLQAAIKTRWRQSKGAPFMAAFLDFSKAFDRTWHPGIMWKAHRFGIQGRAWHWIHAFLTDRQLRVVNNGYISQWYPVLAGVPQGSVISPLLFDIYINDITECDPHGNMHQLMFADDVTIWHPLHRREKLEELMAYVARWTYQWKMVINSAKSGVMSFVPKRALPDYNHHDGQLEPVCIDYAKYTREPDAKRNDQGRNEGRNRGRNGSYIGSYPPSHDDYEKWYDAQQHANKPAPVIILDNVPSYKYLGLTFTYTLDWRIHATNVLRKARYVSYLIRRIIHRNRPPGVMVIRNLVCAIILPIIKYGWPFWYCHYGIMIKLRSAIVQPLRRVLGLPATCHFYSVMVELAIPRLTVMRYQCAMQVYDRFTRLPATNHVHDYLKRERWQFSRTGLTVIKPALILAPIITKALNHISVVQPRVRTVNHSNWRSDDHDWNKNIKLYTLQLSRHIWSREDHAAHLRSIWAKTPFTQPWPPPYVYHHDRAAVSTIARMRHDRTQLKQAANRHDQRGKGKSDICDLKGCDGKSIDDLNHYLYHCANPQLEIARQSSLTHSYHPICINKNNVIENPRTIISFTDGSCKGTRAGAGAFTTIPILVDSLQYIRRRRGRINPNYNRLNYEIETNPKINGMSDAMRAYMTEPRRHGHTHVYSDRISIPHGTNNIGELYAIGLAINRVTAIINNNTAYNDYDIIIAADSQSLQHGTHVNANHLIIDELHRRIQLLSHYGQRRIVFKKVEAHSGIAGNEVADYLAGYAANDADINQPTRLYSHSSST
jgi:ribonuclease HI